MRLRTKSAAILYSEENHNIHIGAAFDAPRRGLLSGFPWRNRFGAL
jgi:hypothetical protein